LPAVSGPFDSRPMRTLTLVALVAVVISGCGGSRLEPKASPREASEMPLEESLPETVSQPLTELQRSAINRTIDEGFGRFLQRVTVEAELVDGKFVGFRIVRFTEPKDWLGVGLVPGDVVTKVNDLSIERPEQAYLAFVALSSRKSLDVVYLRSGHTMRLSLPIVEDVPAVEPQKPAPTAPDKGAKASAAPSSEKTNPPKAKEEKTAPKN
jgi:hypothetical protein